MQWFGFFICVCVIVYNKVSVKLEDVDIYEVLGDLKNKGKLCICSGLYFYNVLLFGLLLEYEGVVKIEVILKGMVVNQVCQLVGGDIDQIKVVGLGECGVVIFNFYYVVCLLCFIKLEDVVLMEKVGIVWFNQKSYGVYVNIVGGGVVRNVFYKVEVVQFLEYLVSDLVQCYFVEGNNEWLVVKSVKIENLVLVKMGLFKVEVINVGVVGVNQQKVLQMLDCVGYK